ncbi:MAG: diguanylate cyclase [Thiobacillus sp.]|nr:diguanylate cyclase [Thiobacillus sp.]
MADTVLRYFARWLKSGMRASGLIARTGGEEFVLVMPTTERAQALQTADRLRADTLKMAVP